MRESYKRCTHCNDVYLCLLSGRSPRTTHSDGRYCPSCLEVINKALREVPKKFERDLVPTEAVDLATLLDWERETAAEREARGGLQVRRVSMPLFNLSTGETSRQGYVRGRGTFAGRNFHYQFWPGRESEAEMTFETFTRLYLEQDPRVDGCLEALQRLRDACVTIDHSYLASVRQEYDPEGVIEEMPLTLTYESLVPVEAVSRYDRLLGDPLEE